ncbi:MAG: hypothetical protein HZB91_13745 [Elusimicrobia bacterium]|nr:hypothetical protein [Elusimicrobiota bacterium]
MKTKGPTAFLVILLASLWIGLEYVALGPFSYADILDASDQRIPIRLASGLERSSPRTSLWMPLIAGGADRLANDVSFFWDECLFLILPGWLAFQLALLGQFFLCSYFTYRLARDRLDCDESSSLFAALCVLVYFKAHPSVETVFIPSARGGHALVPFLLWSLDSLRERRGSAPWGWVVLLGVLNGLCSSISTVLPFSLAVCGLWLAVVRRDLRGRTLGMLAVFSAVSILPHARIAWAMAVHAPISQRAGWAFAAPSWGRTLSQAWKGMLLAKMPLALGLAGLAYGKKRDGLLWSLLAGLIACVAVPGVLSYPQSHLSGSLGFLRSFRWDRLELFVPLFAAVFAGRALASLPGRRRWLGLGAAVLLFLSIQVKIRQVSEWYFWGSYTANFASPVLRGLGSLREDPFRVATIPHGINPAYAQAYGLETADGYLSIFSGAYHRFWAKVTEPLAARDDHYSVYFDRGADQLYLFMRDAEPFVRTGLPFSEFYRLELLSLANVKYLISRLPLKHEDLRLVHAPAPWPDGRAERLKLRLAENFSGKTHIFVYENTTVLPRAFLARRAIYFPDSGPLFDALAAAHSRTMRETVFLEESGFPGVGPGPFSQGKVSFAAYLPDRIELSVDAAGPALLVVTNTFSPFWKCEVDGVPAKILPAFGTFWAVHLPSGARKVAFDYAPPFRL